MANIVVEIRMSNGDSYLADTLIDADSTDDSAQADSIFEMVLGSRFLVVRAIDADDDEPTTMLWASQVVSLTMAKGDHLPGDASYQLLKRPTP